jgi:hypothetical protein
MLRRLAPLLIPLAPLAGIGAAVVLFGPSSACVPPGNSSPYDAGTTAAQASSTAPTARPSVNVMTAPFDDSFDRAQASPSPTLLEAATVDGATTPSLLGPAWAQAGTNVWNVENGRLCGSKAHNHGVWLQRTLPVNARIEFDAVSIDADGDIKCEVWGDGRSAATGISYTNATSYLVIFGGWHNTLHKIARLNEHGGDAKEIKIDKTSDDPVQQPVTQGQVYHFKIERTDGKTVRWSVNGVEYLAYTDPAPLTGAGHDHFGFNDWEAPVCFDNVKVTPLP